MEQGGTVDSGGGWRLQQVRDGGCCQSRLWGRHLEQGVEAADGTRCGGGGWNKAASATCVASEDGAWNEAHRTGTEAAGLSETMLGAMLFFINFKIIDIGKSTGMTG